MTTEQLLAPRYKMIADYPGNSRPIGFIFTMDKKDSEGWYTTTGYLQEMFFTMYPHLFRRLEWWQEREISDLPEYIKELSTGKIGKVFEWHRIGGTTFFVINPYSDLQKAKWFNPDFFAPATHKQYLDFIAPANLSA
jgi:hypothetical protein